MRFDCCRVLLVSMCALACARSPQMTSSPVEFRRAVSSTEWTLSELGGQPAPAGASNQPATLRFDADSTHVSGFAGCNRYAGGYTVDGQSLHFAPLAMTKMACTQGVDLEQRLADALARTNRYELTATSLTFLDGSTPVARFTRSTK